jgi:hypothetical protein
MKGLFLAVALIGSEYNEVKVNLHHPEWMTDISMTIEGNIYTPGTVYRTKAKAVVVRVWYRDELGACGMAAIMPLDRECEYDLTIGNRELPKYCRLVVPSGISQQLTFLESKNEKSHSFHVGERSGVVGTRHFGY